MSRIPIWGCPGSIKRLSALGGEAFCFMADEDVALQVKEQDTTRAVASMEKAARLYGLQGRPLIFAVGNAPTALVRIYELIEEGLVSPALVIGVPVGFVNVVQSKELILTLEDTPYIVAREEKAAVMLPPPFVTRCYTRFLCKVWRKAGFRHAPVYFRPLQQ